MAKNKGEDAKLDMTPMIDVVFQLIIFFVVTMKQEDILSRLDAFAAAPDASVSKPPEKLDLITIDVCNPKTNNGISVLFNKAPVTIEQLDSKMKYYSGFTKKDATIMVRCTKDSPHSALVKAMDICNKYGMTNLALFSL